LWFEAVVWFEVYPGYFWKKTGRRYIAQSVKMPLRIILEPETSK
jgi:hypothetical protein